MKTIKLFAFSMAASAFLTASARGDVVYITSCRPNCTDGATGSPCRDINPDVNGLGYKVYDDEGGWGDFTSARAGTVDKVPVAGARYHSYRFTNSTPDSGLVLSPALAVPGATYALYHVYSSTAGNVSTNVLIGITNYEGCIVSANLTDKFQRKYGQPSPQSWQLLCYVTNNPGVSFPRVRLYYAGGVVDAGLPQQRLVVEQFRFSLVDTCSDVPGVTVTGPLATNLNEVVVQGVSAQATNVTVYQDSGSGMVQIGKKTTGVAAGNNTVTVAGLVKGAKVAATQTINGVEGCKPQDGFGIVVGGGANPRLRVALSLRENPTATGPAGASGATGANNNIHFIPATSVLGGSCPGADTLTLYPSNDWQTVSISLGRMGVGNSANATGKVVPPPSFYSYWGTYQVAIQVYAYKTINGTAVYSPVGASSAVITSNDVFNVKWTWDAVAGADGYRLLRDSFGIGFSDYVDVPTATFDDDGINGWTAGTNVSPTAAQSTSSIMWNPTVGNTNNIAGNWGILESIAFASSDTTDCGPFDLYIDNLANGTNGIYQDFEGFLAGTAAGVVFNQPSYSGTTSGNILTAPNIATISEGAADTGTKSIRVRWQFTSGATNLWMRFNTFQTTVMPSPLVNLDQPITFRILMQPVGSTPVPPARPVITISTSGSDVLLNWQGTHTLQRATSVTGPYTTVTGINQGPYVIPSPTGQAFFRLVN